MTNHFYTSVINSGTVTIFTSISMTVINTGGLIFSIWLPNWLVSWAIVCTYVYFFAPMVGNFIKKHNKKGAI